MDGRNQSRFSTLRVFKLAGSSKPPPPPPKDFPGPYNITPYLSAGASSSQLTLNYPPAVSLEISPSSYTSSTMRSPSSEDSRFLHPNSPVTPQSTRSASPSRSPGPTSAFKKGLTKLSSFGKRPARSQTAGPIPSSPSMSALPTQRVDSDGESSISAPWNFKHHLHVNGDLQGLPPSWSATLAEAGFTEEEIIALRARRKLMPSGPSYEDIALYRGYNSPHLTPASSSSSSIPGRDIHQFASSSSNIIQPNPRSDSLQRPTVIRADTTPSLTASNHAPVRRSPSPANSLASSHPATSTYTAAGSLCSASSPELTHAQSISSHSQTNLHQNLASTNHSSSDSPGRSITASSRSPPPAPLSLRPFRVVNEDITPTPSSPPPAYASPEPTPSGSRLQYKGGMEKKGLHEPGLADESRRECPKEVSSTPIFETPRATRTAHVVTEQVVVQAQVEEVENQKEAGQEVGQEAGQEEGLEVGLEEDQEEDHDADPSDLPSPPSPVPRTTTLPPRLSLHTDEDDGWGDMFSFLPSTSDGSIDLGSLGAGASQTMRNRRTSKRISVLDSVRPTTGQSVANKRRSKRFSNTLAIIPPTTNNHTPISPPPSESSQDARSSQSNATPSPSSTSPSQTLSDSEGQTVRLPTLGNEIVESPSSPSGSSVYVIAPPKTTADIGVITPDPDYPIAASPLWQEVRTLVRDGQTSREKEQREQAPSVTHVDGGETSEVGGQEVVISPSPPSAPQTPDHFLHPHSPTLRDQPSSRFSDASSFQPQSRFSDATSFHGHSRFSDATSFHGNSRFSEMSTADQVLGTEPKSRFSAWSTNSHTHGHPSLSFAPLETMPESPVPPVPSRNSTIITIEHALSAPRRSSVPPPHPPPRDELPPTPTEALNPANLSVEDPRVSHLSSASSASSVSSVQIHGAKLATLAQASVVPVAVSQSPPIVQPKPSHSRSSSAKSGSFPTSTANSQNQHPPPLPLPPLGKVLPSLIASERRKQNGQESKSSNTRQGSPESFVDIGGASPASASSSSHTHSTSNSAESAESGLAYGSSFGFTDGNPRSMSASTSSYEEPPKSPMLPYMMSEEQPSDVVRLSRSENTRQLNKDDEVTVPLPRLREKQKSVVPSPGESCWLSDDEDVGDDNDVDVLDDWLAEDFNSSDAMAEIFDTGRDDSPDVYDPTVPPVTPSITVNGFHVPSPTSPSHREQKDLPVVLLPLQEFIYLDFDPIEIFTDLQEVAQGQFGSVYAAHVTSSVLGSPESVLAVKKVPIPTSGTPKIEQLRHELELMSQVRHKHILAADGLFFDFTESMLWIRMELMERSLADVLILGDEGLHLDEPLIARFASDTLLALAYLEDIGIAHRDVRSDNLLLNGDGVLKLADFSNAVRITQHDPTRTELVGVHHWQAPEIRTGRYDASKVDVWSLGATVWECAESVPPFAEIEDMSALSDRWPSLSEGEIFSDDLHEFLGLCSEPAANRPLASQLLHNLFIQQACPRDHILNILNVCKTIEEGLQRQEGGGDS